MSISRLGTTKGVVRVCASDLGGLARVEHDPVVIEVRAQSRVSEIVRRAEAVIRRYSAYVSAPTVLEARSLGAGLGEGTGGGSGGPGVVSMGASTPPITRRREFETGLR